MQSTELNAERAGDEHFADVKGHLGYVRDFPRALRLELECEVRPVVSKVSAISIPSLLLSDGFFWASVSPSVEWAPGTGQDGQEGLLGFRVVCFEWDGAWNDGCGAGMGESGTRGSESPGMRGPRPRH